MKVVILVWTRLWGGLETHAVELATTLAGTGLDVRIACIGSATASIFRARTLSVPIVEVAEPPTSWGFVHWLKAFRTLGADACIFEKGTLHTGSAALDFAARLTFRAYVTIEQLEPPPLAPPGGRRVLGFPATGPWWYQQRLSGWLRSVGPHRIVCISNAVRDALHRDYGFSSKATVIINNGVDSTRFHPSSKGPARKAYGIADEMNVVATACRLVPEKGVDVAIRAFARVVRGGRTDSVMLVAGDGVERGALESLVGELGLSDGIRFLGFVEDPSRFIPAADVFVVPSRVEAQGIVVLEALASGCDVIATAVGGIPEVVQDSGVATLVAPDDPDGMAERLEGALARSTAERASRAEAARTFVRARFDARTQCERIGELIRSISVER
jgi:glycosyltransferase involved in cell wall biosynthesis